MTRTVPSNLYRAERGVLKEVRTLLHFFFISSSSLSPHQRNIGTRFISEFATSHIRAPAIARSYPSRSRSRTHGSVIILTLGIASFF